MSEWQDIATVPVNAKRLLLWCADRGFDDGPIGLVLGRTKFGHVYADGLNGNWNFTHWQPLPSPPKAPVERVGG